MKKLLLKVEELHVESFEAVGVEGKAGTVRGHEAPGTYLCSAGDDCTLQWSCGVWCPPTQNQAASDPCACLAEA
jgi:hypothetical protein